VGDGVERTEDGRYVVVAGRRWRASDPAIPESLRQELVDELMAARRAVRTEGAAARARVQDAKVALGERGEPWWDAPTPAGRAERLAAAIRTLLRHRRPEATICPSDAARVVGGADWRAVMDDARSVVAELRRAGSVRVLQRGVEVDPEAARGPIRVARGPAWPNSSSVPDE
jgi:hypothetical protein